KAGIDAGADSILVSHNIVEAIDKNVPASISPKVHELIRKDLGFEGVVMTDDMDMNGLSHFISQEEAALAALKAGNDLILSSTYKTQIPVIKSAIQSGDYKEEDVDRSVLRVLTWKHELGLISLD
ncbi:MAG: beta-hexosaminidase, partial [Vagococcus sp.]|nr:beta-hexosaminidase [Vagococcus sp.]